MTVSTSKSQNRALSLQDIGDAVPKAPPAENVIIPPDGGWGWVVVVASFLVHVILDGITYTFGIFYMEFLAYFKEKKGTTAWVASIMVGVTFCIGPIASALTNRYGCRIVTIVGAVIAAIGLFSSLFVPSVWYLYFTIGILTGSGFGLMYLPAIVCVTCYFETKRSFATGIAVCGSGVGTFALAPLVEILVKAYGWKGAMLIVSALVLNCCIFGALFRPIKPVILPKPKVDLESNGNDELRKTRAFSLPLNGYDTNYVSLDVQSKGSSGLLYKKDVFYSGNIQQIPDYHPDHKVIAPSPDTSFAKDMFGTIAEMLDLSLLKDPIFLMFGLSNFFTNIGFNVPYVYIKDRAVEMGLDNPAYLLSVIGISNTLGRIVLGYLSDKSFINRLWLYNICLTACGVSTALSSFCVTFPLMAGYASLFGITAGAYVSLTSVILVDLLGLDRLTNAFGLLLVFEGIACLIGPPITGLLFDSTGSYDPGFFVSGAMIALSGLMLFLIPCVQRLYKKKG